MSDFLHKRVAIAYQALIVVPHTHLTEALVRTQMVDNSRAEEIVFAFVLFHTEPGRTAGQNDETRNTGIYILSSAGTWQFSCNPVKPVIRASTSSARCPDTATGQAGLQVLQEMGTV